MSDIIINKSKIQGTPRFTASKSLVQRGIFTEFLFNGGKRLDFFSDFTAGKDISFSVEAIKSLLNGKNDIYCGDNATLFRLMLPIRLFVGERTKYILSQRLFERGNAPLLEMLKASGAKIEAFSENQGVTVEVSGKFDKDEFYVNSSFTSQILSGFLLGGAACGRAIRINTGRERNSFGYAEMTCRALGLWGFDCFIDDDFITVNRKEQKIPDLNGFIENDWSHNANWLALGALCGEITLENISFSGLQGDEKVYSVLKGAGINLSGGDNKVIVKKTDNFNGFECNANDTPDLIPILCVLGAFACGKTVVKGMKRLRFKESDRFEACCRILASCDCGHKITEDTLEIIPDGVSAVNQRKGSHILSSCGDHRISMAGAVMGTKIGDYTVKDYDCTGKSSFGFYEDFLKLGGSYSVK